MKRTFATALAGIFAVTLASPAWAAPTYYYCYAFESDGSRLWVSQIAFGDSDSSGEWANRFKNSVLSSYSDVNYFSAVGCRPPYENTNQQDVIADRNMFVRNNSSKSIINF